MVAAALTVASSTRRSTDLAISFFTFLTVLANLATVGIVGLAVATRFAPGARRLWLALREQLAGGGLGVAWLVAAASMSGSLYFSEVADFVPCRLCWAQRYCMYPLVVVLALAAVWRPARWIGLALSTVGAAIAVYHVLIERFPSLESGACDPTVPCSLKWFEELGFVTLPSMALSAFLLITTLLVVSRPQELR